jgi:EpsG family
MWAYWAMFLLPAIAAVAEGANARGQRNTPRGMPMEWIGAWAAMALVVGLRWQVGGDWFNYEANLDRLHGLTFWEALTSSDPGFALLSWITLEMDWGIMGVNMMIAPLFALALVRFCRSLPRPWLALAISIPYLVVVVGMGYSRQGVALACAILGLLALSRRSPGAFLCWVLLGATFHKTAVLLLPIAMLVQQRNRFLTVVYAVAITIGAYFLLLSDSVDDLYVNYVLAEYQSEGALIRLLMNGVPAVLFLRYSKRFGFTPAQTSLWRWFAWISLLLLAVLLTTNASTAVDRVGLYMLPLQLVVFSRLPEVFGRRSRDVQIWTGVVVFYYAVVFFTWLNFATHSQFWLPYRFYPLELLT